MVIQIGTSEFAKFPHPSGVALRLQAFLLVRDGDGAVATVRLEDDPEHWLLPGELMRVNEDPDDAAERVARTYFQTPIASPRLRAVESFPATGPQDNHWYLIFLYEAEAPEGLEGTPDTVELAFAKPGEAPGPWGYSHGDVWERIKE